MVMELSGAFQLGITRERSSKAANNMPPEFGSGWYFSRKELESISPSRKDGIDSKIESELRMRYCSFLKDFGMRLGAPQVTIATAIVFCHRFYLHQSHAKNDWKVMATVCMFLASKAEDTPLSLDKVVIAAYEMIHKRDPATASRIHQKDVFEKQKALILIGERLLLATIRSDFNVQHPYRPLLHALKKFGITQKDVRQVAWNFVNDSIQTTLCLQYKPHYIAAGSLFLAAKLHNVKLPAEKGHMWWHEFDVTPQQLNAAIQDMMELPGCKKRPTADRPLEKQAPVNLKTKEEISSSPESCVLSRPGSSRSSSSQFPDGEANGGQRPKDISVPNNTSTPSMDIQHPSAVRTEVQCQARDSKSKSSIIDDCQGSDECIDQAATTGPKSISAPTITSMPIMDIQHPYVVRTEVQCPVRDSKNKSSITDDCQGSDECMDQATTRPEQALEAECLKSGEGINRATSMLEKANCQGSDERLDKTTARSEHALEVEDFSRSGEGIDRGTTTVLEKAALIEHCQGTVEDVNQAGPNPEQYAEDQHYQISLDRETIMSEKAATTEHCQGTIEGVIQEGPNPEQSFGDQDCQKPVDDVDQERADPEQAADVEDCEGFGEDVEQSRGEPASQLYVEGVDQARTEPAHLTETEIREGSSQGLDQARAEPANLTETEIREGSSRGLDQSGVEPAACLLYVVGNVDHQARSNPDQVPSTEVSMDSVKGMMHPAKAEPEQVEDRLGKVDMDRIRALRRKKRERETNHRSGARDVSGNVDEGIETAHKIRSKPEQVDMTQGSGRGERGQVEGIAKLDTVRIKALMLKRKRERESKMARDTNNANADAWIERELEAGIEFTADCSQKKRRLS